MCVGVVWYLGTLDGWSDHFWAFICSRSDVAVASCSGLIGVGKLWEAASPDTSTLYECRNCFELMINMNQFICDLGGNHGTSGWNIILPNMQLETLLLSQYSRYPHEF